MLCGLLLGRTIPQSASIILTGDVVLIASLTYWMGLGSLVSECVRHKHIGTLSQRTRRFRHGRQLLTGRRRFMSPRLRDGVTESSESWFRSFLSTMQALRRTKGLQLVLIQFRCRAAKKGTPKPPFESLCRDSAPVMVRGDSGPCFVRGPVAHRVRSMSNPLARSKYHGKSMRSSFI